MKGGNQNQMHPDDARNMMIFFAISLLLFVGYYNLVMKPKSEELRKAQKMRTEIARAETGKKPIAEEHIFDIVDRSEALGKEKRIPISSAALSGSLSIKGARINDVSLNAYFKTLDEEENVTILSPTKTKTPRYIDNGWVSQDDVNLPTSKTIWVVKGNETLRPDSKLTMFWDNGQGILFERVYEIDDDYLITLTQKVVNRSGKDVSLHPYGLVSQRGIPDDFQRTRIVHQGLISYAGEELHEVSYSGLRKEQTMKYAADNGWLGITDKYWLTALIPSQGQNTSYRFASVEPMNPPRVPHGQKKPKDYTRYQADFTGPEVKISAGDSATYTSHMFVGAKEYAKLGKYEKQLNAPQFTLAVNFGWFWFLAKPFFYMLHYLGKYVGNFGLAIILLTIIVRSAVFPLTNVAYVSAAKMKKLAPEQAALREKCGDDKAALQKEIMELYKREGVNPMGCLLPMMVQIPVFFALYKVLFVTIEMRQAPFFGWIQDLSAPDPTSFINLYGLLPYGVPENIPVPIVGGLLETIFNIGVWPTLMLLTFIVQKKLNPPPQDKMQRDMANYFPFIMAIMLGRFASGLVIYWTFSALIGLTQQIIIMRKHDVPIYLFGQTADEETLDKALDEGGPSIHPLAEMAEHEVEDAMFGEIGDDASPSSPPKKISPPKPKRKKKKK